MDSSEKGRFGVIRRRTQGSVQECTKQYTSSSSSGTTAKVSLTTSDNVWLNAFKTHLGEHQRMCAQFEATKFIRRRIHVSSDRMRNITRNQGDVRAANVLKRLNNLGYVRSKDQMWFHQAFFQACLPKIYGKEWENSSMRVMESYGITDIRYEVMAMTPRRWGKTVSVAMFVAALLLDVPGLTIAVFSTGKRASGSLTELVKKMICNVKGGAARVVKASQEDLYIAAHAPANGSINSAEAKALQTAVGTSKLKRYEKKKKKMKMNGFLTKTKRNQHNCMCLCVCVVIPTLSMVGYTERV